MTPRIRRWFHPLQRVPMFGRFTAVALLISLIDAGGLYALSEGVGINVYLGRVFSYLGAVTAGYFLNRHYTFPQRIGNRGTGPDLLRFYGVFAAGGAVNYAVFLLVLIGGQSAAAALGIEFWLPLIGVWLGGIAGMSFNYQASSRVVFDSPN